MAKRVTFLSDCDVPAGRAIIAYKAGHSGLIPEAHFAYAVQMGALKSDGDAKPEAAAGAAEENSGRAKKGHAPGA